MDLLPKVFRTEGDMVDFDPSKMQKILDGFNVKESNDLVDMSEVIMMEFILDKTEQREEF